ncbi:hypothetical protein [Neogemmobacter tilapiae]|uniref:DUF3052 family protein n=1 Tax=Neogemmobacter tilapiae TaxID=875041 RepID=A0A918TP81_9RHOB|nr:hypothetical protein [Gemmobacter tilapiae]GHC53709.1 hypothetical protein GCM10007315_15580 [Gemmobacter tilapiae]
MGREAEGHCQWNGHDGVTRAILEREALILRGEVKGRIAREALLGWGRDGGMLSLQTTLGPVTLALGEKEAEAWVRALDKPLPSLAERLGLGPGCAVLGVGLPDAVVLPEPTVPLDQARLLLAPLQGADDLARLLGVLPGLTVPVWCLHRKGKGADPSDATIRVAMRGAGWMDTKVSAVDDIWTASRYNPPKA